MYLEKQHKQFIDLTANNDNEFFERAISDLEEKVAALEAEIERLNECMTLCKMKK